MARKRGVVNSAMVLDPSLGGGILLAEEIFAQVAAGGIAIIISGFLGAVFVGLFANVDELEKEFQASSMSENEKRSRLSALKESAKTDTLPSELQKDIEDRSKEAD